MREDIKDYPGYVNTCISPIPLGQIVNPVLKKLGKLQTLEAVQSYPIESLMTGNVRTGDTTPLDVLEEFLSGETESIAKYAVKPEANNEYVKTRLRDIAEVQEAVKNLRKNKTEVWLHLFRYMRAAEKEFGLCGSVTINFPLRHDVPGTCYIDFINGRAIAWKQ